MSEDLGCDYASDVDRIFADATASWLWKPGFPVHAELTTGLHSGVYHNYALVEEQPGFVHVLCRGLLHAAKLTTTANLRFVGAAMGGISLAHECARITGGRTSYVQKDNGSMRFMRFAPGDDRLLVPVEDVISTGHTSRHMLDACLETGAPIAPFVLTLIHRGTDEYVTASDGSRYKIIPLMRVAVTDYAPDECPYCKAGSTALRPKDNWKHFIAA